MLQQSQKRLCHQTYNCQENSMRKTIGYPYHTRKHICYDSRHNLLCTGNLLLVFYTSIDTYHRSAFVLNYIFYYQIPMDIHMKYVLQVFRLIFIIIIYIIIIIYLFIYLVSQLVSYLFIYLFIYLFTVDKCFTQLQAKLNEVNQKQKNHVSIKKRKYNFLYIS